MQKTRVTISLSNRILAKIDGFSGRASQSELIERLAEKGWEGAHFLEGLSVQHLRHTERVLESFLHIGRGTANKVHMAVGPMELRDGIHVYRPMKCCGCKGLKRELDDPSEAEGIAGIDFDVRGDHDSATTASLRRDLDEKLRWAKRR